MATPGEVATQDGIGFCDAAVSDDATTLSVDLSIALPISDTSGKISYLGPLSLAILNTPDSGAIKSGFKAGIAEGAVVTPGDVTILGDIGDYANAGWLAETTGQVATAFQFAAALQVLALIGLWGARQRG